MRKRLSAIVICFITGIFGIFTFSALNAEGMEEYYYIDYVAEGGTIENIPPEPTREGYEFMGWFTDETGTEEYDFSQPINAEGQESLSLFAGWHVI